MYMERQPTPTVTTRGAQDTRLRTASVTKRRDLIMRSEASVPAVPLSLSASHG